MKRTMIRGTGRFLPPRIITNDDLSQWMDTSDEWIRQRTGIDQRYWVPEEGGTGVSDLAFGAATIALERSGWSPQELDLIIFATLAPEFCFPGAACLLQHKLGLHSTPALDIRQQCTGFIHGLEIADAYIRSGLAKKILLVGAEIQSNMLDISTRGRNMAVLFGDGAGVVCLEAVETEQPIGVIASVLHAQGEFAESLMMEAPSGKCFPRITEEMVRKGRHFPVMDGRTVFKNAVRKLPEVAQEVLEKAGMTIDDIDMTILHQANLRINLSFQKTMGIPDHKIYNNIHNYGNTTAASIPIALDEALEKQLVNRQSSSLLFVGLGAGLTWGGVVFRFG